MVPGAARAPPVAPVVTRIGHRSAAKDPTKRHGKYAAVAPASWPDKRGVVAKQSAPRGRPGRAPAASVAAERSSRRRAPGARAATGTGRRGGTSSRLLE